MSPARRGRPPRQSRPRGPEPPRRRTTGERARGVGGEQVEGRQAVRELLVAGRRKVHEVVLAAGMDEADILEDIVELAAAARVPVRTVARTKFDSLARTDAPQGVLARAAALAEVDLDVLARRSRNGPAPFLVAVDGVTDPGNLGALIRSAEGNGVTGIVLPRHRAVHVTPAVTKAAAGAVEHVAIAVVGGLPTAIRRLQDLGVWVVGLDAGGPQPIERLTLAEEPVALVLGAEGRGLSRLVRSRCDVLASLTLRGRLSSLNVAAAGAIACYEVARHRAEAGTAD